MTSLRASILFPNSSKTLRLEKLTCFPFSKVAGRNEPSSVRTISVVGIPSPVCVCFPCEDGCSCSNILKTLCSTVCKFEEEEEEEVALARAIESRRRAMIVVLSLNALRSVSRVHIRSFFYDAKWLRKS